jgi:hypothetical protein
MEAASTSRRSLGEYFVEKGLITPSDLERAQAEHLTTKRRLADVLVKRGLVTGADITRALMDQLGMAEPPAAAATVHPSAEQEPAATVPEADRESSTSHPQPDLVLVPRAEDPSPGQLDEAPWPGENAATEPEPWPGENAATEPEPWPGEIDFDSWPGEVLPHDSTSTVDPAPPAAADEPEPPVADEPEPWHTNPWDVTPASGQPAVESAGEAEPAVRPFPEFPAETPVEPGAPAEAVAPPAALENVHATIEARRRELSEAIATAASWTMRASELQVEIDALVEQANAAVAAPEPAEPDAVTAAPPGPLPVEETGAVFLVPGPDRFELVEVDVDTPGVGETVHLDDRRYVVTEVTSSPLPFDRRKCAILAATVETSS